MCHKHLCKHWCDCEQLFWISHTPYNPTEGNGCENDAEKATENNPFPHWMPLCCSLNCCAADIIAAIEILKHIEEASAIAPGADWREGDIQMFAGDSIERDIKAFYLRQARIRLERRYRFHKDCERGLPGPQTTTGLVYMKNNNLRHLTDLASWVMFRAKEDLKPYWEKIMSKYKDLEPNADNTRTRKERLLMKSGYEGTNPENKYPPVAPMPVRIYGSDNPIPELFTEIAPGSWVAAGSTEGKIMPVPKPDLLMIFLLHNSLTSQDPANGQWVTQGPMTPINAQQSISQAEPPSTDTYLEDANLLQPVMDFLGYHMLEDGSINPPPIPVKTSTE